MDSYIILLVDNWHKYLKKTVLRAWLKLPQHLYTWIKMCIVSYNIPIVHSFVSSHYIVTILQCTKIVTIQMLKCVLMVEYAENWGLPTSVSVLMALLD